MANLFTAEALASLVTLTALELVLGIDNIIFLTILTSRLPPEQRARARRIGLVAAMLMRIALLTTVKFLAELTHPIVTILGRPISGRDLVLIIGGAFLVAKATSEIHEKLEGGEEEGESIKRAPQKFWMVIAQIMVVDIVFSLDSVITAVGMARMLPVMITAVVLSVLMMMFFAGPIGDFVNKHPTMKVLALSFLILIGVVLVMDGLGRHVSKAYIYTAMAFSFGVELLNMRLRPSKQPVKLHDAQEILERVSKTDLPK